MENIITFASMTNAMRAKEALNKSRIYSQLIRTPARLRKGSCGYSLVVKSRFSQACGLIKELNIPYKEMIGDDAP